MAATSGLWITLNRACKPGRSRRQLFNYGRDNLDKTPAQLNKLYPPLQPREWYRAEWPGDKFTPSRELERNFTDEAQTLRLWVTIKTEPNLPIRELHGRLVILKGQEVVYETQLAEKPKVSFTDDRSVFLRGRAGS